MSLVTILTFRACSYRDGGIIVIITIIIIQYIIHDDHSHTRMYSIHYSVQPVHFSSINVEYMLPATCTQIVTKTTNYTNERTVLVDGLDHIRISPDTKSA